MMVTIFVISQTAESDFVVKVTVRHLAVQLLSH